MESTGSIRVLHVDDDPDFADLTATVLERETDRFTVETATSASSGLDVLAAHEFDCVVSDYGMPGRNGIEFLETVREEYPDLPFILFTGEGSEDVASDAISAGVTDYLQKDSDAGQYELLVNRITNAVSQYRTQQYADEIYNRLQELSEAATDILYMFNHDWRECLFVNSAYEDIFGRSLDRLYEQPQDFLNGVYPDHRDRVMDAMETISSGESVDLEYRVNPGEGYGRWVEVRGKPIFDGDGSVVRIAGFARDITKRKGHEQELQQTRNRMEFALEATDAVVWDWNVETDHATFYPSAEALYGTTVETLDDFTNVVHPDDRQRVREALEYSLETGEPKDEEIRIVRDDVRWIEAPGKPVSDDSETRMIGVARDITDRKRKERELQRQNDRLERFARTVSHDLRNPLNVAQGQLELVRDECNSDRLEPIERAHERIEQLIDDILALAREGEQVQEAEPVALAATAERSWQNVATAEATLVVETERTVQADQSRLQQLLENLFRNAIKHGGENVKVTISDLHGEVGFAVADDGPGIPEDERDRVFDPGYSTTENGTGFGLAIIREIAQAHDWEIGVTDSADGGARFEFATQQ